MWTPTLNLLKSSLQNNPPSAPVYAITYDRYGQVESISAEPDWKPVPHDIVSAGMELAGVISRLAGQYFPPPTAFPKVILVSHSIGVPLVRVHEQNSEPRVYAHLFLDSNIANSDFVSIFPDPDAKGFDEKMLPDDASVEDLRMLRNKTAGIFSPEVRNSEGLDRRNLKELLPHAEEPKLIGPGRKAPWLSVVGHDPVAFADEGFRLTGTPRGLNEKFMQPVWDEYNAGLLKLGDPDRTKGVVIAKGAGHFIQRDNPTFVAEEVRELIEKVLGDDIAGAHEDEREMGWKGWTREKAAWTE